MVSNLPCQSEIRSPERALADLIERRHRHSYLRPGDLDRMIRGLEAEIAARLSCDRRRRCQRPGMQREG
jgi:hypothetical protein